MKTRIFSMVTLALSLLVSGPAMAQTDFQRTVTVRGTGIVSVPPDQVRLSMQIVSRAQSASSAMTEVGGRTNDVLQLLQSHGVEERDIQTKRISVVPEYDREKRSAPPAISGYAATSDLSVLFREDALGKLGLFLDKAVAAGVTNIGGMQYETSDRSAHEQQALTEAARDARTRAERLAAQLGVKVGKVISISEAGLVSPGPMVDYMTTSQSAAPVMVGEMDVVARVDAVFELVQNQE